MPRVRDWGMRSVTVSYRRVDGNVVTSRVGYGETYAAALLDADRQLSDGVWKRLVVSNSASVYSDVRMDKKARLKRATLRAGENKVIRVTHCVSEELDVA